MAKIKIVFEDDGERVLVKLEGDIPDDKDSVTNAQITALETIDALNFQQKLQEEFKKVKKDLTNDKEDDKTKYKH